MRTKDRNQFNCYLKDEFAVYIREQALAQGLPVGEVIEDMCRVYNLLDLKPLIRRFITVYAYKGPQTLDDFQQLLKVIQGLLDKET